MHPTRPFLITNTKLLTNDDKTLIQLDQPPPRNDFQGAQLTGSLLLIHMVVNSTDEIPLLFDPLKFPGKDGNRRYCFTLFTHLAESYNFTYRYIYSDVWGYPQPDGNWSGMVGQIYRREADVGLSAVHYSIQRTKIVDFVGCLDFTRVCFTFLQPKLFGSYKALILPLDKSVWACLLAIILFAIFLLRVTSFYDNTACHNDSWGGSFLLVMAAFAQQGIPDSSNKLATKLLYLSILVVSFLAVVHYNTSILNGLLLPAPNAIQNIEQLIDSDLKVATSNSKYVLYDMTLNDSLTVKLRNKMLKAKFPNNGVFTIKDGLDMLKKGGFALYVMAKEAYPQMHSLFSAAEVGKIVSGLFTLECTIGMRTVFPSI
ncbi:hypothetical protein O3M35_003639 [Rhynocoris fuscipes]|uniref:Ionotropic glutamate receptor L-glutamate and glycine-binding domain-containing protein n=1 Tax=Rhynocoris fuscipes TaxID=488301 RepID=A0AAW1CL40_9HEMI